MCFLGLNYQDHELEIERIKNKLYNQSEPTKQYTKSQNKYAPKTKQLKIKDVGCPNC